MKRAWLTMIAVVCLWAAMLSPQANAGNTNANYATAKAVVTRIFPIDTRWLVLKIVGCETGQRWEQTAHNQRSDARGYFQILASHNGHTYSYNGISVTVDSSRLYDGMYNTLVAYVMSDGGHKLSDWYASSGCWQ